MKNINSILKNIKHDKLISVLSQIDLFNYCNKFLYTNDKNIYTFYSCKESFFYKLLYIGRTTKDAYFLKFRFDWNIANAKSIINEPVYFSALYILENYKYTQDFQHVLKDYNINKTKYEGDSLVIVKSLQAKTREQEKFIYYVAPKNNIIKDNLIVNFTLNKPYCFP